MRNRWHRWACALLMSSMGGWLFQTGCLRTMQNEIDLLLAPEANLDYVHQSGLVKTFGPEILNFSSFFH